MPSLTHLILIRHGETAWTRERRYQGQSDTILTKRGQRQARAAAKILKVYGVDFLYTSSLKRAKETGDFIAKASGKKPQIDARLNELHFGKWEGRSAAELSKQKDPTFRRWCEGKIVTPPGGESILSLRKRTSGFVRDCIKRHRGKTIAVVSHGGPIKTILFDVLKLSTRSLWFFRIEPASISLVNFYPHFAQLIQLNNTSHLGKQGLL